MQSHRLALLSLLVACLWPAVAFGQDEQVSPTVNISIYGFTVSSDGTVYYYYSDCFNMLCPGPGYIASGTHSITDGANGNVTKSTFGGTDCTSYNATITAGTTYSHCYIASVSATGRAGTTQRVNSGTACAPPAPPPPSTDDGTLDQCGSGPDGCSEPLLIKVDNGPYNLTGLEDPVSFDLNADGHAEKIGWTGRGANVAFLALDVNGNGVIDDGKEVFGNGTLLPDGTHAANGFQALAQWDANGDGVIDARDPVWQNLLLWVDANHDGICQPSELQHITDSPITSIDLTYHWAGRHDQYGNMFRYEGQIHKGSATSPLYDVYFVIAK